MEMSDKLILKVSDVLGRYFIASCVIHPDEVIFTDTSVVTFPWSSDKSLLICVGCYKELDVPLTASTKCTTCKWPVCNATCEQISDHANFECIILSENNVEFNSAEPGLSYFGIQTLRCLLLEQTNPKIYEKIQKLEAHVGNRDKDPELSESIAYVIDFIQNKCKLFQHDGPSIKHAFGAVEINPLLARGGIHAGVLFLAMSFLAHDCVPNTTRDLNKCFDEDKKEWRFDVTFKAAKLIDCGEIITTHYGDLEPDVLLAILQEVLI